TSVSGGFYVKTPNVGQAMVSASSATYNHGSGPSYALNGGMSALVAAAGTAVTFKFETVTAATWYEDECREIKVRSVDAFGNYAPVTSNMMINLSQSGSAMGAFFEDDGCLNPMSPSEIDISNGMDSSASSVMYYKPDYSGTLQLSGSYGSPGTNTYRYGQT